MLNLIMTVNAIDTFAMAMVFVMGIVVFVDMLRDDSKTFHVDA